MKTKPPINIKRGLQRIWTVCSIFWAMVLISLTIYYFPEKPSDTALVKIQKNIIEAEKSAAKQKKENLGKGKEDLKNKVTVFPDDNRPIEVTEAEFILLRADLLKNEYEKTKKNYDFDIARYEEEKNSQSQLLFIGLGLVPVMWGLLYIGFWISKGFRGKEQ